MYSDGGKTVTITMKGWKWSNGETVSAQDVIFWLNMMKAEKANFYGYVPGLRAGQHLLLLGDRAGHPGDAPRTRPTPASGSPTTSWPSSPRCRWPGTSPRPSAKAGSGGCTTDTAADKWAKCTAVYNFLAAQAKTAGTYATSPIWGVVDGPWKLSSYNTNGNVTIVPNPAYSGSPKPSLTSFKYVPFTDSSTEYTALKTGQLNVGAVPTADLPQKTLRPRPCRRPTRWGAATTCSRLSRSASTTSCRT